eukprot:279436_1
MCNWCISFLNVDHHNDICNPNCNNPTHQSDIVHSYVQYQISGHTLETVNLMIHTLMCECISNAYFNGISCMQPIDIPLKYPTTYYKSINPSISPTQNPSTPG